MISDSIVNTSNGKITSGIELDSSIKAVLDFVREHFVLFAKNNKKNIHSNEKGLTQKLCIHLNRQAKRQPFYFQPEYMENTSSGSSPQVDIGTISDAESILISDREYSSEDSFFSLEAKRLPTLPKSREREYVIGSNTLSGAIERFKKGIHGRYLKYAAIIGYVQNETFDYWFVKINSWIEELARLEGQSLWTDNDKMEKFGDFNDNELAELKSLNGRTISGKQENKIHLFHFWISLIDHPVST
jgi:hypothetical protein